MNELIAHSTLTKLTGLLYKGPVLLESILVNADGAAAEVDVYDGENDRGEHKYRINCLSDDSKMICLPKPTDFDFGIYIKVNAATTFVTVQFSPVNIGIKK